MELKKEKKRKMDYSIIPADTSVLGTYLGIVPVSFEVMETNRSVGLLVLLD